MRIQFKLLLFAILCSVIPLLCTFILSFGAAKVSLTKTVEDNLVVQASETLESLQNSLAGARHDLTTLSQLSNMQNVRNGDPAGELQNDLDIFAKRSSLFAEIAVVDLDGFPVAGTLQGNFQTNLSGTWEFEAPRLGVVFDGPVANSNRLSRQIATHSVPLYSDTDPSEIIGVLIGSIDWNVLYEVLATHTVFGGRQGPQRQIFLESIAKKTVLYGTEGVEVPEQVLDSTSDDEMVRWVSLGDRDHIMVSLESLPIQQFRDPQWRIHFLLDSGIAHSSVGGLQRYFIVVGAIVLLMVSGLGFLLARNILNPVKALLKGAENLAAGNYDYVLPASNDKDEIGQLTNSFNAMRESVKKNQQELVKKTRVAEQAARLKGEFLANMSHEVRTPINGVLGMTELLLNTELDATQNRYAATISRSGNSLLAVINDILDFSKIEAGKLELSEGAFDLRDLVEDVVELFSESAHKKGVEVALKMDPGSHLAYSGDANRLRQILLNLIGNAVKFTSVGEVILIVTPVESTADETLIKFIIADTGIGVPAENQQSIFESFVQADGSTTRQFGGTGLGLAISANLAALMGGEIGLESEPGNGSTFWFSARLEKLPSTVERAWRKSDSLVGKHILIVDDTQTNREILATQAAYWGASTVVVDNSAEALAAIELAQTNGKYFHAALLDMNMPKVNGVQLAKMIHERNIAPDMRLLILSSSTDFIEKDICKGYGVNAVITKPVRQLDLYNCLTAAIMPDGELAIAKKKVSNKIRPSQIQGKVLLAEDNPINQDMMLELLGQLGVVSVLAENGQVALNAIEEQHFDLVLMDCQMPVLDGFGTTHEIRLREKESQSSSRLPIIALTANALEGDKERCLESGMDDYLSKPVSSLQLAKMLEKWLVKKETASVISGVVTDKPDEAANIEFHEILDEAVFSELWAMCSQASDGFYSGLVDKYAKNSEEDLLRLSEAIGNSNAEQVGAHAHRLKSSTANLGGQRMANLCQTLENMGKSNSLDEAQVVCDEVGAARTELLKMLRLKESKAS